MSLDFESDGIATTTISLSAIRSDEGEAITGWDNVVITKEEIDGILEIEPQSNDSDAVYDLSGRRVSTIGKGIYIRNRKKVVGVKL